MQCPNDGDVMSGKDVRRWCSPRTILVVMRASDDPAQVLWAMRQAEMTPSAKVVLAQLRAESQPGLSSTVRLHVVPPWTPGANPFPLADSGRSLMWNEIVRRAFVLRGISVHEIPGIVQAFKIDRVIATSERGGAWSQRAAVDAGLMAKLRIPVWILGRGMAVSLQSPLAPRRVLVPVSLRSDVTTKMKFASGLASGADAVISVLHVIEHSTGEAPDFARTPLGLKAWIARTAREFSSSGCSIEIAVRQGDPAATILEYNARRRHDLVLLSCTSERNRKAFRSSSVLDRLCSEMPCPIVVLSNAVESRLHLLPMRAHEIKDQKVQSEIASEA
jgi:hypothetical protein